MTRAAQHELPLHVLSSFDAALKALGRPEVDTQACFPRERLSKVPPPVRDWRLAQFASMKPTKLPGLQAASCDLIVGYRPSSRIIWSVVVADASRTLRSTLHGVPVNSNLHELLQLLGPPIARHPHPIGSLIDVYWWRADDLGFRAQVFRENYDGFTGSRQAGDLQELEAFSYALAPPWHGSSEASAGGGA